MLGYLENNHILMDNDIFELELHVQVKERDDIEDDQE